MAAFKKGLQPAFAHSHEQGGKKKQTWRKHGVPVKNLSWERVMWNVKIVYFQYCNISIFAIFTGKQCDIPHHNCGTQATRFLLIFCLRPKLQLKQTTSLLPELHLALALIIINLILIVRYAQNNETTRN